MQKKGFTNWITQSPKKAFIILLAIILPLIVILLVGLDFTRKGKSFYFEKDNDKPVLLYQKNITKQKTMNEYFTKFDVTLTKVSKVTVDDEVFEHGKFDFLIEYELADYYKGSQISFKHLLKADWFNEQSDISSGTKPSVRYPYNLPKYKHLVLKVYKPVLYIEIKINRSSINPDLPGVDQDTILYYKYDLKQVSYDNLGSN